MERFRGFLRTSCVDPLPRTDYCVNVTHQPLGAAHYNTDSFEAVTPRIHGLHEDESESWSAQTNQTIASQIRDWRKARGLSAQQLSDRCTAVGHPIPRNIIANVETGRRVSVTVPELIVLAMALNVPPALLIYPVGKEAATRVAPQQATTTWNAAKWFVGESRPGPGMVGVDDETDYRTASREWESAHDLVTAYQRHDALVRRYRLIRDDTVAELKRMAEPSIPEQEDEMRRTRQLRTDMLANDLARAIDMLRGHRLWLETMGLAVPSLPPDIDLT
ncbi:helix-turn-helix transcriptional regulator [Micromonospora sp. NPDC005172]|uniref:helix-turn-helix domain-containing protein n=1 Tax=Micromonospora sp. NPDC005172 TaxID=3156867 RepID=UPI0033A39D3F